MTISIRVVGAGGRGEITVHGPGVENITLTDEGVEGIYDAPTESEWWRPRRMRGGMSKGIENPERDILLPFAVRGVGGHDDWMEYDNQLRHLFTYELDQWDMDDELAQLVVDAGGEERRLRVQMGQEPQFAPKVLKHDVSVSTILYRLKAGQPMWEGREVVSSWETGTAGSSEGEVEVSNPTDQPMFQTWVLTPGKWYVPDFPWSGPRGKRVAEQSRIIPLKPVTAAMGALTISLNPMERMFSDMAGTNVMGQVSGGYWFMNEIPPYTPKTVLPLAVENAPAGGARAELHQPRLWSRPWGGRL